MDAHGGDEGTPGIDATTGVPTVYWRPGCPWCARLRRGLAKAGVPTREVDIWQDPVAAAAVRAVATGNETVPTVVLGERALVNPSVAQVLELVGRVGRDGRQGSEARRPAGALRRAVGRLMTGATDPAGA